VVRGSQRVHIGCECGSYDGDLYGLYFNFTHLYSILAIKSDALEQEGVISWRWRTPDEAAHTLSGRWTAQIVNHIHVRAINGYASEGLSLAPKHALKSMRTSFTRLIMPMLRLRSVKSIIPGTCVKSSVARAV